MSRSFSLSTRLLFSRPATVRSMASSKSAISTAFLSLRAASNAASLTMLARSAPAKPRVQAQDGLAPLDVRLVHHDLAVEASRPQHRLVEHIAAVGGLHQHHALRG